MSGNFANKLICYVVKVKRKLDICVAEPKPQTIKLALVCTRLA